MKNNLAEAEKKIEEEKKIGKVDTQEDIAHVIPAANIILNIAIMLVPIVSGIYMITSMKAQIT